MPSSVSTHFQLQLSLNTTQSQLNSTSTQTTELGTTQPQLVIFHTVLINVDMITNTLYLTWCNAVDGYWMVGDPDTNTGGIASATVAISLQ